MAVHTLGYRAHMDALLTIARRHGLLLIEDARKAIGAEFQGRKVAALGDAGVLAFYPNRQITTGEGGMMVARIRSLRRRSGRNEIRDAMKSMTGSSTVSSVSTTTSLKCIAHDVQPVCTFLREALECLAEPYFSGKSTKGAYDRYRRESSNGH